MSRSIEFDALVRQRCRFLGPGDELQGDALLVDLGVDSVEVIELIVALEDTYDFEMPQDRLTPEAFVSPDTVWELLCSIAPQAANAGSTAS